MADHAWMPPRSSLSCSRRIPVQARSRERVERLLDTAARLVDELGPDAVTTASIAAAAGVSIGWLYDFFPNRESVFDAVVERSFDKVTPTRRVSCMRRCRTPTGGRRWTPSCGRCSTSTAPSPGSACCGSLGSRAGRWSLAIVSSIWPAPAGPTNACTTAASSSSASIPEHAIHLVIGIIDKGLDLAFLIDPDGDRDIIEQTIVAAIAYLERYAAHEGRSR